MSAGEIAFRCRALLRQTADRVRLPTRRASAPLQIPAHYLTRDYLAAEPARRFFPADVQQLKALVRIESPDWISRATAEADAICANRVRLLGRERRPGAVVDWCADPVSGRKWPRRFWADYDLVGNPESGDPKQVFELNRHQYLVTLARAYAYSGEERYANAAIAHLDSWIEQNPVGVGVNWHSSLEVAFRAMSWTWTLFLLLPSKNLDDSRISEILKVLFAHFAHILRYPSSYSSPNTHLLGEALALCIGGTVFSAVKQARAWREFGESVLIEESSKQILDDGFHAELSIHYHCYALEFYLTALSFVRRAGRDFPEDTLARIARMTVALADVAHVSGTIPQFSDDDGGRACGIGVGGYRDVRPLFSTAAVLFHDPRFKWHAQRFDEETLWLLGGDAYVAFERLERTPPDRNSCLLPSSGFFVSRSGWNSGDDHLVFDCGSLGYLGGGHGHADALSFVLSFGDREILVDSGTGVYNAEPEWRDYFRSTRAHNTVVVDGQDQAIGDGTFGWATRFSTRILRHFSFVNADYIEAEHDGYSRLANPIVHRRRVLHVRPHCWLVVDDFRGEGHHTFETFYHFPALAAVSLDPRNSLSSVNLRSADRGQGLSLAFYASNAVEAHVIRGSKAPIQGWLSKEYGDIQPAPVLRARVHDSTPSAAMTVLVPRFMDVDTQKLPQIQEEPVEDGRGTACTLFQAGIRDLFVMSLGDGPIRVGDFLFEGEFFWVRRIEDRVREVLGINAKRAALGRQVLFENPSSVSCVNARMTDDWLTTIYGSMEASAYVRH